MITERDIVTGLIVSTDYLKAIRSMWDINLIESVSAKRIALWCWEYFEKYNKAPQKQIEGIFFSKMKESKLSREVAQDMEEILNSLSEEFDEDTFNVEYLFDETRKYFTLRRLELHTMTIKAQISEGKMDLAEQTACNYKPAVSGSENDIDIGSEEVLNRLELAFKTTEKSIIEYRGAIGEFWNGQLVKGGLVALLAPEKRGKCITGTQKIMMSNGDMLCLYDLLKNGRRDIISYDEENDKFLKTKIDSIWKNGIKKVYKVTTRTGRQVEVTLNHPFLTPSGWKELSVLKENDFIAVPKDLPFFGDLELSDYEIKLIAYFLTEGCLFSKQYKVNGKICNTKIVGFTTNDPDIKLDFEDCIEKMGCSVKWRGIDGRVTNGESLKNKHGVNFVLKMLENYGLMGKSSESKFIPDSFFSIKKESMSLFLKIIFTCDGWVNKSDTNIGICLTNKNIIYQIQSMLIRFGIVSKIRSKVTASGKIGWVISIRDFESIEKFYSEIGFCFSKQKKLEELMRNKVISYKSFLDKFPNEIALKFYEELKQELGGGQRIYISGGYPKKSKFHTVFPKANDVKYQINKGCSIMKQSFLPVCRTNTGKEYFRSPVLWDTIIKIEYIGEFETFDLTVNNHHNFIAENVIIHNTFLMIDLAIRAANQNRKVAFFQAGDLSESNFLKRISVYLAQRSDREKYCKEHFQPVRDCIRNQLNSCINEDRTCNFGVFEDRTEKEVREDIQMMDVIEAYNSNPNYHPCTSCDEYREYRKRLGVVWMKKMEAVKPLTLREAKSQVEKFFINKKRQFKLSTYANNTLTINQIRAKLDIWEKEDGFVPDLIVIDYADLIVPETRTEFRHQQNEIWKGLRRLSQEKGQPLVITATQSDADSYEKGRLRLSNFSEDKRKYGHATAFYGLNQDPKGREKRFGIMRINELLLREDEFDVAREVTILQNLKKGRPFLGSYW